MTPRNRRPLARQLYLMEMHCHLETTRNILNQKYISHRCHRWSEKTRLTRYHTLSMDHGTQWTHKDDVDTHIIMYLIFCASTVDCRVSLVRDSARWVRRFQHEAFLASRRPSPPSSLNAGHHRPLPSSRAIEDVGLVLTVV